ncbi:MAG: hypothetical protein ABIP39_08375, partial [Polyangiaceae bacterium]
MSEAGRELPNGRESVRVAQLLERLYPSLTFGHEMRVSVRKLEGHCIQLVGELAELIGPMRPRHGRQIPAADPARVLNERTYGLPDEQRADRAAEGDGRGYRRCRGEASLADDLPVDLRLAHERPRELQGSGR